MSVTATTHSSGLPITTGVPINAHDINSQSQVVAAEDAGVAIASARLVPVVAAEDAGIAIASAHVVPMVAAETAGIAIASAHLVPVAHYTNQDEAGKGMGIAMFILLIVALPNFILPYVSSCVCVIAAIIIASNLTCRCCGANKYNLKPNVKRFAMATLVSLVLIFVTFSIGLMVSLYTNNWWSNILPVGAIGLVLYVMAVIFSALFTWGRGCCASS